MSLTPLLNAPAHIQVHAFAAIIAFLVGLGQFVLPKGTQLHRVIGYTWVSLMLVVAIGSFWIQQIRMLGPFSPIHVLSVITIYSAIAAVLHARAGRITAHKRNMQVLFLGALVIAGGFTFTPGRLMGQVLFGT